MVTSLRSKWAVGQGERIGVSACRRVGVSVFAKRHQLCRDLLVIIAVSKSSLLPQTPIRQHASPSRPIFNATLRAAASWLFFRPAAAGLARALKNSQLTRRPPGDITIICET